MFGGKGSCCSADLSWQWGPMAGQLVLMWWEGVVSCCSTDLSTQGYIIVGLLLFNATSRGPYAALTSVGNGTLSWVDCFWFSWEGVLSKHCMGPHHSLVVLNVAGKGPVAALTSECNRTLLWAGFFRSSWKGSCCSTDLSMQWGPIACQRLAQAWPG